MKRPGCSRDRCFILSTFPTADAGAALRLAAQNTSPRYAPNHAKSRIYRQICTYFSIYIHSERLRHTQNPISTRRDRLGSTQNSNFSPIRHVSARAFWDSCLCRWRRAPVAWLRNLVRTNGAYANQNLDVWMNDFCVHESAPRPVEIGFGVRAGSSRRM